MFRTVTKTPYALPFWLAVAACLSAGRAFADPDEYGGAAWKPYSTPTHPCGVGVPPRGTFADDRWITEGRPGLGLVVRQEGTTLCYVLRGIVEAPTIRVKQGAAFSITLRNEITDPAALAKLLPAAALRDAALPPVPGAPGMMGVVPGKAPLPTGRTNLHVHGFAVPPTVPQDEVLMGCVDPADGSTACGRREMTYRYQIPADMPPGLYWYHPHVHGEVQAQMLAGLSGAIVVEGPDDEARARAGIEDRVFIVRQLRDSDAARPAGAPRVLPARAAPGPAVAPAGDVQGPGPGVDTRHELDCAGGKTVDEISLNGTPVVDGNAAEKDLAPLSMMAGTTQLWRVVNAATDAILNLALVDASGQPVAVRVVARDGAPVVDDAGKPAAAGPTIAPMLVPPAGRVEFLVTAPPIGQKQFFVTHAVDTGCTGDLVPERRLAMLTSAPYVSDSGKPPSPAPAPTVQASMFDGLLAKDTDRTRVLAFAEYPRPGKLDQTDFYIAERRPGAEFRPFTMDGPPAVTVRSGTVEEWTVQNFTHEIHAFHIHQLHFRVLATNGRAEAAPPLLDTVIVPAMDQAGVPGSVRIKLAFPDTLAGDIPLHCHLVDHEDNGMMGVLRVLPRAGGIVGVHWCRSGLQGAW
jgi:FtsP/CotA-like multicopper oxidase with cupredoxin domain